MKPLVLSLAVLSLCGVSCTPNQKTLGTTAATGAVLGTIIADGDNHKKGALIGAAAGAAAGVAVNKNREKKAVRPYYY